MHAQVALAEIARSGLDLADLRRAAGRQADAGADGAAVALRADQRQQHRVVAGPAAVSQQLGGAAVVRHQQIEGAVVVDVAGDERAADRFGDEARS